LSREVEKTKTKSIFQLRATNRNRNDNQIQTQAVYYGQQHCLIDFKIYGIELNFFFLWQIKRYTSSAEKVVKYEMKKNCPAFYGP
jgi:hypothetical protein